MPVKEPLKPNFPILAIKPLESLVEADLKLDCQKHLVEDISVPILPHLEAQGACLPGEKRATVSAYDLKANWSSFNSMLPHCGARTQPLPEIASGYA